LLIQDRRDLHSVFTEATTNMSGQEMQHNSYAIQIVEIAFRCRALRRFFKEITSIPHPTYADLHSLCLCLMHFLSCSISGVCASCLLAIGNLSKISGFECSTTVLWRLHLRFVDLLLKRSHIFSFQLFSLHFPFKSLYEYEYNFDFPDSRLPSSCHMMKTTFDQRVHRIFAPNNLYDTWHVMT
jgi:hypothetical protein